MVPKGLNLTGSVKHKTGSFLIPDFNSRAFLFEGVTVPDWPSVDALVDPTNPFRWEEVYRSSTSKMRSQTVTLQIKKEVTNPRDVLVALVNRTFDWTRVFSSVIDLTCS